MYRITPKPILLLNTKLQHSVFKQVKKNCNVFQKKNVVFVATIIEPACVKHFQKRKHDFKQRAFNGKTIVEHCGRCSCSGDGGTGISC